jgi:hypothetical protein
MTPKRESRAGSARHGPSTPRVATNGTRLGAYARRRQFWSRASGGIGAPVAVPLDLRTKSPQALKGCERVGSAVGPSDRQTRLAGPSLQRAQERCASARYSA